MAARGAVIGGVAVLAVVALLLVAGKASARPATPNNGGGNKKGADVDAEAEACAWVIANRPKSYGSHKPTEGETEAQWLTRVAYWRARPNSPVVPESAEDVALFARLAGCVSKKLPPPKNEQGLSEAEACAYAVDKKPIAVNNHTPESIGAKDEVAWLSFVAWWLVYPGRTAPNTTAENQAFDRLRQCIASKLEVQQLPPVNDTPKPGGYYRLKQGDTLFGVSKTAFGTSGNANLTKAQHINDALPNLRFRHFVETEASKKFWPAGALGGAKGTRINFYPVFGTFAEQIADAAKGAEGKGKNFAVIYIPEA